MKTAIWKIGITLFIGAAILSSCNKDKSTTPSQNPANQTDTSTTQDKSAAVSEKSLDDVNNQIDNVASANAFLRDGSQQASDLSAVLSPCASLTIDTSSVPWVVTLNFGTENCLCPDGKYRRGEIIAHLEGPFWAPGNTTTVELVNYYVNDYHVTGTRTITHELNGSDQHPTALITLTNGSVTSPDNSWTVTRHGTRTREFIAGYNTFGDPTDNVYQVSFAWEGTNQFGLHVARSTTEPIVKAYSCDYPSSGVVETTLQNHPTRLLDYGNGNCDNLATVTVNGVTINITLP